MSQRIEQINSVLQKDIATYAVKYVNDPEFITTVRYASCNADFSFVIVGITTFPEKISFIRKSIAILDKHRRILQLKLARDHKLKNIPRIKFVPDENSEKVDKIEELLQKVDHEGY